MGVHFKYFDHFNEDEKVYRHSCSITALKKGSRKISEPREAKAIAVETLNNRHRRKKLPRIRRRNPEG